MMSVISMRSVSKMTCGGLEGTLYFGDEVIGYAAARGGADKARVAGCGSGRALDAARMWVMVNSFFFKRRGQIMECGDLGTLALYLGEMALKEGELRDMLSRSAVFAQGRGFTSFECGTREALSAVEEAARTDHPDLGRLLNRMDFTEALKLYVHG